MPDDDFGIYKVNSVRKSPEISILPPFASFRNKKKKEREKEEKRKRDTFKENFFSRFKLDQDKFSLNLIRKNDRWLVEIYNNKTKKRWYQDYATVCNILDIHAKLPKIVGANIDRKV